MAIMYASLIKILSLVSLLLGFAAANVEKAIFLGPAPINVPTQSPTLSDLRLDILSPSNITSIRTALHRLAPSKDGRGGESWFLLDNLTEGQRYEVRVCWSALEPTKFGMDIYELDTVWTTPGLIQSLAVYANSRQPETKEPRPAIHTDMDASSPEETFSSVVLLRVTAEPEYFTDVPGLMDEPPPVLVDLILDPFIFNLVPKSLLPTGAYIIAVAALTSIVALWFVGYLGSIASSHDSTKKQQ